MARKKKVEPVVEEAKVLAEEEAIVAAPAAEEKVEVVAEEVAAPKPAKRTRKPKKPVMKTSVTVEYNGKQALLDDIVAKAEAAYKEGNPEAEIESLDVYVKPQEGVAYYVVNGEGSADFKVSL